MARPEAGEIAERLYAEPALRPWVQLDGEETDWHLLKFLDAVCSGLFEQIHLLVSDRDDLAGWTILLDPDLCPSEALRTVT